MIRKVALLFVAVFFCSLAAQAQISTDKIELYGGYSFLHFNDNGGGGSFNQNGWELAGQYKFFPFLGAVADFSGDYGNGVNTHYFLFGPQVSLTGRVAEGQGIRGQAPTCPRVSPAMDEPHYRLGQAYARMGEKEKARRELGTYAKMSGKLQEEIERERSAMRQFVIELRDNRAN